MSEIDRPDPTNNPLVALFEKQLQERDAKIAALEQQLEEREDRFLARMVQELQQRDARIAFLEPKISYLEREIIQVGNERDVVRSRSIKNRKQIQRLLLLVGLTLIASTLELAGTLSHENLEGLGFDAQKLESWFHWASAGLMAFIALVFGGKPGAIMAEFFGDSDTDVVPPSPPELTTEETPP